MGEYNTTYIPSCSLQYGLFGHTFFEGKPSAKKPSQPHCIIEEATAAMSHKVHLAYLCNSISQDLQFYSLNFFQKSFLLLISTYYPFWDQVCWRDIFNECFCKFHQKENNVKISYRRVLKNEVSCDPRVKQNKRSYFPEETNP